MSMLQLVDCVEIYPTMRCTILYCYTVLSKIVFFSWDLFSPQVQKCCCKSSGNHPQLAHSYRSRHDLLQHVVALSGCWKHLLLFELQKPWQIYHCLVFFANVSISNKFSINLLWFSQKLIPNLLPGQSLVLPCCLFSWEKAFFVSPCMYHSGRYLIVKHFWVKSFFLYFNRWV